jgi:hypothetical protein
MPSADNAGTQRLNLKCVGGNYFSKGENLRVQIYNETGVSITPAYASFTVFKVSSPQTLAGGETVFAAYNSTISQSIDTSYEIIDFQTKEIDTHNAVTTGASWKFTAPRSGVCEISTMTALTNLGNWAIDESSTLKIYKNGSELRRIYSEASEATNTFYKHPFGSTHAYLAKGDYIDVRLDQASGAALGLRGSASVDWVTIHCGGN